MKEYFKIIYNPLMLGIGFWLTIIITIIIIIITLILVKKELKGENHEKNNI